MDFAANEARRQTQKGMSLGRALWETAKNGAKLFLLIVAATLIIAAVIGVVVWKVEYSGDPGPFNGAKVKKQTVWEADGLKVDTVKLEHPVYGHDALVLKVKNGSGRDLAIKSVSFAMNGGSLMSVLDQTVAAGETRKVNLEFENYADYLGVDTPGIFTFELEADDPATGDEILRSGILTVRTTKAENMQTASFKGYFDKYTELFEESGIKVGSYGYLLSPIGPGFGIDNTTDRPVEVTITVDEISSRGVTPDGQHYRKSAVIQAGTIGNCFVWADFEELRAMDGDGQGEIFPVH
ncbi:MAG: hypothetical protein IJT00_01890, partial [Lachnospiraceae bacterium]|nr:hypothetical protein [Lachnospiraceae bacterium]